MIIGGSQKMQKLRKAFLLVFICICAFTFSFNESYAGSSTDSDFKIIGYYFEGFQGNIDQNVQFDKLTHIMYAFLIPAEDGSLIGINSPEKLRLIVEKGHKNGVKVLISVGGWSYNGALLDSTFEKMAASDGARNKFVKNVVNFVDEYNLDGVDMDWEYPDLGQSSKNYEKLIVDLNVKLKNRGKYLTAAVPGSIFKDRGWESAEAVSDRCLKEFDWINIMAYDGENGPGHSTFSFSETSLGYWNHRGVPKEKLVLGVPFYGRLNYKSYKDLVAENRNYAYQDVVKNNKFTCYYNGIETIKEKTRLALRRGSGIMAWEISLDTNDDLSLLKTIYNTAKEASYSSFDEFYKKVFLVINGHELTFKKEEGMGIPFIDENNRTLIPVRKPLETIGAEVSFDKKNNIVIAQKGDTLVKIPINKDYIQVNDKTIKMDTYATIIDGRTYIPLRYVFEGFNYNIKWHEGSRTVIVNQ
jgi:chitinase